MKQLTTVTTALRDTSKWDFTKCNIHSYNRPLSGLPDTCTICTHLVCCMPLAVMHIYIYQANPLWSCYNLYIRIYRI